MWLFGGMFDCDHVGKINGVEKAAELAAFASILDDLGEEDEDELKRAGIDPIELEDMDEDELRETLEDAGLDPDDYDF